MTKISRDEWRRIKENPGDADDTPVQLVKRLSAGLERKLRAELRPVLKNELRTELLPARLESAAVIAYRDTLMRNLRQAGVSAGTLADATGLTRAGVYGILGPHDAEPAPKPLPAPSAFAVPPVLGVDIDTLNAWLEKNFAAYLRDYRERHGLTQRKLAATLGIPAMTIANWEKERNRPPLAVPLVYMLNDLDKRNSLTPDTQ